jgi:uncharacterized protein
VRDSRPYPVGHAQRVAIIPVILALLFVNSAAADICGYPEKGTLVVTRDGIAVGTFRVGLAETRDQQRKGLMGCRNLAPGSGLLFIYPDARPRTFWMKDTPLPLAIVFISSSGRIAAIEAGQAFSTQHIRSPDDIQYVLEIHPAEADVLRVGDRITLQLTRE